MAQTTAQTPQQATASPAAAAKQQQTSSFQTGDAPRSKDKIDEVAPGAGVTWLRKSPDEKESWADGYISGTLAACKAVLDAAEILMPSGRVGVCLVERCFSVQGPLNRVEFAMEPEKVLRKIVREMDRLYARSEYNWIDWGEVFLEAVRNVEISGRK